SADRPQSTSDVPPYTHRRIEVRAEEGRPLGRLARCPAARAGGRVMKRQVATFRTTTQAIMRRPLFAAGVNSVRSGHAPDFDDLDDEYWSYERGRLWACLAPSSMPLTDDQRQTEPKGNCAIQCSRSPEVHHMSKRTKAESNDRRGLLTIVEEIRETLRRDNSNIIRRGELLIEAKAMVEHGEWLSWLERYFDMSEDTAERLMSVARFADRFRILRNMALSHLPKGVLYALASGDYSDAIIKAVLVEAESHPIAIARLYEIEEELNPEPEPNENLPERDEVTAPVEAEGEAEEILDGRMPGFPTTADPPAAIEPKHMQLTRVRRILR